MKYPEYSSREGDILVYDQEGFSVYKNEQLGLFFLVLNGKEVAFKNFGSLSEPMDLNCAKWISNWKANGKIQLIKLQNRVEDLLDEQMEIAEMLVDTNTQLNELLTELKFSV